MSLNTSHLAIHSDASASLLELNEEEFEIELIPNLIIQKKLVLKNHSLEKYGILINR